MSGSEPIDPPPAPAEERLDSLLDTLRVDAPEASHALVVRVVQRARWQGAVRSALRVVTQFAAVAGGVARVLMGRRTS